MAEILPVQWFPGHMAKTRRLMQTNLKLVDLVVELTDARIPQSSRNPEIDRLLGKKPRMLLLNKSDSANEEETRRWLRWYKDRGSPAMASKNAPAWASELPASTITERSSPRIYPSTGRSRLLSQGV